MGRVRADELCRHVREEVTEVSDVKAQALVETAADVLNGVDEA